MFKHPKSSKIKKIIGNHNYSIHENNLECLYVNFLYLYHRYLPKNINKFFNQPWGESLKQIFSIIMEINLASLSILKENTLRER